MRVQKRRLLILEFKFSFLISYFALFCFLLLPTKWAEAESFISSITDASSQVPDETLLKAGLPITHNSGALVCYYNTKPSLNKVYYTKRNWIWGKIPPPTPPRHFTHKNWLQSLKGWILSSYIQDKEILEYKENLLRYNNNLIDTSFMVPGTRLPDGTLKAATLTHEDLTTICKNSMVWRGVFGEGVLDVKKYDESKAKFVSYAESTRYFPIFPTPTEDFSRPILPADVDNPALVKSFLPTKFRNVVAFGDSLSDQGNIRRRMLLLQEVGLFFPSEPYWGGRFTDEFNWLDELHQNLGLSVFNWAFASAQTSNIVHGNIAFSLTEQVDDYLTKRGIYPGIASPFIYGGYGTIADFKHTLYSVLIGGNNYIGATGYDSVKKQLKYDIQTSTFGDKQIVLDPEFVSHSIADIKNVLDKLIDAGARSFIVGYLPDMSQVPEQSADSIAKTKGFNHDIAVAMHNRLSEVIKNHNAQLKNLLTTKYKGKGVTFYTVDLYKLVHSIQQNPEKFQTNSQQPFNTTQACYNNMIPTKKLLDLLGGTPLSELFTFAGAKTDLYLSNFFIQDPQAPLCSNPQNYLFWDNLHPTSRIHKHIADTLSEYLKKHAAR